MKALEASVRSIEKDGLVWGTSKLVPVGFGIKKLQINLVIEDDKIGLDDLQEEIQGFEDYVQSTDIVRSRTSQRLVIQLILLIGCYAKTIEALFANTPPSANWDLSDINATFRNGSQAVCPTRLQVGFMTSRNHPSYRNGMPKLKLGLSCLAFELCEPRNLDLSSLQFH